MSDTVITTLQTLRSAEDILISVIIACYNAEKTLSETLEALCTQEWDGTWEIILSDNRCTDGSVDIFQGFARRYPQIAMRLVDASAIKGQPHAMNVAIHAARGKSVLFCDADDVVAPGWLAAMGGALQKHEFVAARMDLRRLNEAWVSDYRRNKQELELEKLGYPPFLHHAGGGTFGFHKSVFDRVGEFDHNLPCLMDTDFCIRAQLAGFELHYVPDAVIYIRSRSDLRGIYLQAYNYAKYNLILSKRYRAFGRPAPRRWVRFFRRWISLAKVYSRPRSDMVTKARARRTLGWTMGLTAGILTERYPPP
jgi:glycosyltransferase involved in cell wall biosynthesis